MAEVGNASIVMVTVSVDVGQVPFEIVHTKIFSPGNIPVSVLVGEFGFAMVPVPETSVHIPFPTTGIFPASVSLEEQSV